MAVDHVRSAIQLEQWLMEGAFNKVLAAGKSLPAECSFAVEQLTTTVRWGSASAAACAMVGLHNEGLAWLRLTSAACANL